MAAWKCLLRRASVNPSCISATHQVEGPECHCSVQDPRHIESAWGSVVLVRHDGSVSVLHEKPLNAKLELLYSKSLFLVALNLAQSEEVSVSLMLQLQVTAPGSTLACGPINVVRVWYMRRCEPCANLMPTARGHFSSYPT